MPGKQGVGRGGPEAELGGALTGAFWRWGLEGLWGCKWGLERGPLKGCRRTSVDITLTQPDIPQSKAGSSMQPPEHLIRS